MGQALYRKYRSKSLDEVVGQEHITATLASVIKSGRISHAYLFTGPRGTGKTSVARIFAHAINELDYTDGNHLDIIEIDAASNRRIDDIRDLREKVHIAPTSAKYKVYIIDEVHMLTGESFNALLKTLEEPPAHVVFILATTEVHKLPATIISRTQRYSFRLGERKKVMGHLAHIAKQEKIEVDEEALELIAEHGDGSFRDSVSLLDQLANVSDGKITADTVEQNLGLAPKKAIKALVEALQKSDHKAVVEQLAQLEERGTTTASLIPQLIRALQITAPKDPSLYSLIDILLEVPRAYNPSIKLLTSLVGFTLKDTKPTAKTPPAIAQEVKPLLEVTKEPARGGSNPSSPAKSAPAPTTKKATPKKEEAAEVVASGDAVKELLLEQWAAVLAKIKSTSPPFFGVLRHAQPDLNAEQQVLTLKFRYPLHQKKADDNKMKQELAKAMLTILGGAPAIKSEVDKESVAPDLTMPSAPASELDETSKSVVDIMGGGEAVTA